MFEGLPVAMVTPFRDGASDLEAMRRLYGLLGTKDEIRGEV